MYENELARGINVHLEAGDEGRGGANSWLATQPLWGAYSIRFERWTVIFSVNFDYIWEVLKVLESGSGEDLAVFCRSVISYCGKKGVEVKETIIKQKKIRQKKDQTKITKIVFVWRLTKEIQVKVKRVYNWVGEIGNCKVWPYDPGGATPLLLSCCTLLPLTWPCRLWCLRQEIVTMCQPLVSSSDIVPAAFIFN